MKVKINGKTVEAKLPKRFKERWVRALRSGKYLQADSALYDKYANNNKGGNCCIGVAGNLCGIDNKMLGTKGLFSKWNNNVELAKKHKLPNLLIGAASSAEDDYNQVVDKLSTMNDSGKWSFNRIASYVEKYL